MSLYKRMICEQYSLKEELSPSDENKIVDMIRLEVASIFFDLFKRRNTWM